MNMELFPTKSFTALSVEFLTCFYLKLKWCKNALPTNEKYWQADINLISAVPICYLPMNSDSYDRPIPCYYTLKSNFLGGRTIVKIIFKGYRPVL